MMRRPETLTALEELGRVRLSRSFYMREFLYSEIAAMHGLVNVPDDPELAIRVGRSLCESLLEPLQERFGRIAIRSAYRSCAVNEFGNSKGLNCASNAGNYARHIWAVPTRTAATAPWPASSFPGLPIATQRVKTGARWPGGSMTTCHIRRCTSSPSWRRSTLAGTRCRSGVSTAMWRRAVA